jgi:hypothetical protein
MVADYEVVGPSSTTYLSQFDSNRLCEITRRRDATKRRQIRFVDTAQRSSCRPPAVVVEVAAPVVGKQRKLASTREDVPLKKAKTGDGSKEYAYSPPNIRLSNLGSSILCQRSARIYLPSNYLQPSALLIASVLLQHP